MEKNTALSQITDYRHEIATLEYRQQKAVIAAKAAGASWAEIGTALDLTKQRAHQKYAEAVASAERMTKWKAENPEEAAAAEARGVARAAQRFAEIKAEVAREMAAEDHAAHVEATAIFLDGTAPAPEDATTSYYCGKRDGDSFDANVCNWKITYALEDSGRAMQDIYTHEANHEGDTK